MGVQIPPLALIRLWNSQERSGALFHGLFDAGWSEHQTEGMKLPSSLREAQRGPWLQDYGKTRAF